MSELCPVCGSQAGEEGSLEFFHEGRPYHFCSLPCLRLFQQYPDVYLGEVEHTAEVVEDSTVS